MKPCRQDNDKVQRDRRWQRPKNLSSSYPQEAVHPPPSTGVIDTRTLGKPKTFTGQPAEWTTWQFTFKAFACATHARMRDVFELATRKGSDLVINSDMTVELQSSSTQLYYMLVMMLSDQALEIVRNSPDGVGAEVWRKLLWEYEPGVGIRYGAMLLSLLKRRFGEHDETDLARETESFERDISKYEQQSSDLISDAIKHGIVWRHGTPTSEKAHRSESYKALRDEIINNSRARRTWRDPNALQVDAVHVDVNQERQVDGSGSRSDKGKSRKGKSKKGGKGKGRGEKVVTKFDGECRYCLKRGHKKPDCRKMKSDIAAGKCDKSGKPIGVNALSAAGSTQPSPQASYAPSMASTIPLKQMVPVYFPCPDGSQTSQPTETWYINMIVPAQKTLMVASLDGAEYALLDSGSGLTSCPINKIDDIPLLPRPANLPILSNATGGSVDCIGQRQVGNRLENGEPFVVTWHVANVRNLIISTESLTGANIEVRHAEDESSMIMDRCGTQTSVILHKFPKVPWLKLRRDNSVLDSDLKIAAVNTKPMAIEEIDSDEERDEHA